MRTVLITGGTGYLGQALVRQLLAGDRRAVVFAHREESLRAMALAQPDSRIAYWLGDVRDKDALARAIRAQGVTAIIHTAAIKSVPACEAFPLEAIQTNVGGTANVLDVADAAGIGYVVCLSSDKAVQSTGVYGATKALLERLCVAAGVAAVRCGNLIGSTGSVLPIWRDQLAKGEPITVTDPAMTRFYMPVTDAAIFVLHALAEMTGGQVFVPKLAACRLGALADAVSPHQRIVGARAGERAHELLLLPDEPVRDCGWAYVVEAGASPFGQRYRSDVAELLPVTALLEAA